MYSSYNCPILHSFGNHCCYTGHSLEDSIHSLQQKRVLLGISGGIAAYKTPDLVRKLKQAGAEVEVIMTDSAEQFVTRMSLQTVSGKPPHCNLFTSEHADTMQHISLARWADLILLAPATADLMARLVSGRADDLLSCVCLACSDDTQTMLAPAMNTVMWNNAATRANAAQLQQQGWHFAGPASGDQACGEVGVGRMLEPAELVQRAAGMFRSGALTGKTVVVSAGPTHENIDPVRFIGNRSSGRMGFALASAAAEAGAKVVLIAGPVSLPTPQGVARTDVVSARQMYQTVMEMAPQADIFIACAAVADYRPAETCKQKIKRQNLGDEWQLRLTANPDIVASVAAGDKPPFILAFAAESENLRANAERKLRHKKVDMVAANDISQADIGFDCEDNAITLVRADGAPEKFARAGKNKLARILIERVAAAIPEGKN